MLQFYFLSVLLNVLTGLVLVFATDLLKGTFSQPYAPDSDGDDFMFEAPESSVPKSSDGSTSLFGNSFLDDQTFRLVLGILTAFMGMLKLFVSLNASYAVIDDLFPALSGMAGGFLLLIEFIAVKRDDLVLPDALEDICVRGRKIVGGCCIAAGVLHFIIPRAIVF